MSYKTLHKKTRARQSVAYSLAYKFDQVTLTFDLWPWKLIGFQILLRTKYEPSLVKIHWRMLILEYSQGCYGRTDGRKEGWMDGSITISLCNFIGEGKIKDWPTGTIVGELGYFRRISSFPYHILLNNFKLWVATLFYQINAFLNHRLTQSYVSIFRVPSHSIGYTLVNIMSCYL